MKNKTINAFNKGWMEAPAGLQGEIKQKIMDALRLTHRNSFFRRRHGWIDHTPAERIAIEKVFAQYHIYDPWGE